MFLHIQKVIELTSLSKSTIYRLIKENQFPRPVKIAARRVGWRPADIDAFIASPPASIQ